MRQILQYVTQTKRDESRGAGIRVQLRLDVIEPVISRRTGTGGRIHVYVVFCLEIPGKAEIATGVALVDAERAEHDIGERSGAVLAVGAVEEYGFALLYRFVNLVERRPDGLLVAVAREEAAVCGELDAGFVIDAIATDKRPDS